MTAPSLRNISSNLRQEDKNFNIVRNFESTRIGSEFFNRDEYGVIGGNGIHVGDNWEMIMALTLSLEECKGIVDWLNERQLPFYFESKNCLFGSPSVEINGQNY